MSENIAKTTIEDFTPMFHSIDKTSAVFQESTITYNETGLTYNTFSSAYGGSDRKVDKKPVLGGVVNI